MTLLCIVYGLAGSPVRVLLNSSYPVGGPWVTYLPDMKLNPRKLA